MRSHRPRVVNLQIATFNAGPTLNYVCEMVKGRCLEDLLLIQTPVSRGKQDPEKLTWFTQDHPVNSGQS